MEKKGLDEVVERSSILLPKALNLAGVEHLFSRMEELLKAEIICDVRYTTNGHFNDNRNLLIKGRITLDIEGEAVSGYFRCYHYRADNSTVKRLEFEKKPGCELSGYDRKMVALWDRVRYFITGHVLH